MSNEPLGALEQQLSSYQKDGRRGSRRQPEDAGVCPGWTRFAAAAGASLAAASNADATIQHIVPVSPIRVTVYDTYATVIDLDGVGGYDLQLGAGALDPFPYYGNRLIGTAHGIYGAQVIGDSSLSALSARRAVHRFNYGDVIPAAPPTFSGAMLGHTATSYYNFATYRGQFPAYFGTTTGYAGFVNDVGGSPHAGWIKIRTEPFAPFGTNLMFAVSVLEWAYEDQAFESIMAGHTMSVGGPDGDYNDDGVVDAADYTVWRDKLGTNESLPNDPNGGTIDEDQYNTWKDHFGAIGGTGSLTQSAAGAVPEPSTISLGVLAMGAAGIAALRRRSK